MVSDGKPAVSPTPAQLKEDDLTNSEKSGSEDDDQICMRATVAQHSDNHGTKLEDLAGTGENDAPGG
ncbi:MAG TPA: hypothetical protein VM120_27710 [Bryobacteraceae bacterium]|nr:hypothetical protein [Bryobacteraceae bacterium]